MMKNKPETSANYQLKPESRWMVSGAILFVLLGVFVNGVGDIVTWALVFSSVILGVSIVVVFPHIALKKMDD